MVFTSVLAVGIAWAEDIQSDDVYAWSRDTSRQLTRRSGDYLLGLGGSPASIMAFLRVHTPGQSATLPLSNFRYFPKAQHDVRPPAVNSYGPLTEADEKKLFEHFDRFVPTAEQLAGRRVVLLDYTESGSIFGIRFYLGRYFAARGRTHEIAQVILTTEEAAPRMRTVAEAYRLAGRTTIIPVTNETVLGHLKNNNFSANAEFPRFSLNSDTSSALSRQASFVNLALWMASRATEDSSLPRAVRENIARNAGCALMASTL